MSRHHDKLIAALTAPEPKPRRTAPRSHREVESFVKGLNLSAAATRQMVEQWNEDIWLARNQGYEEGYDEGRDE